MNRGRLRTSDLPIRVDEITTSAAQQTIAGEPEWALTVRRRSETTSGRKFVTGRAALRREIEKDVASVSTSDDGVSINQRLQRDHTTEFGVWMAVDNGWAIVSDDWVAGVLGQVITPHLKDTNLDLRGLLADLEEPDVWQLGFAGRGVAKGGRKGVLYGSHVNEDPEIGDELMHTPLNELGVEHIYQSGQAKAYFAASTAYVELYGGDWSDQQFVDYVGQHVVRHVKNDGRAPGETGEGGGAGVDENQETFDELDSVSVSDGGDSA
ncbi:hypothetical protein SAMN06269185_3313 [Natronoarchaeum philippinense]|uniref:Uncharacterized protein n=1 Tax=Natronoarchaeum philippinense TaxID=558529 RepID=A0A285P956_NATPI|nr:hypothetical protein [Natronoarchaeum philippinense]SNZ18264.1 hypothetical protein SAMN06269185_3313 [Natronoarchaeum philippinense]